MRALITAVGALALTLPVATADEKADAVKKLNGSYEVRDYVTDGKSDPLRKGPGLTASIKDGTIEFKEANKDKVDSAGFTLDPSKKPAQIDIRPGLSKEKVVPGIYEIKETDTGTQLTIAFAKQGGARPKDFKGEEKGEVVLKLFRKK